MGCDTPDGTFKQIVSSTDAAELAVASVAANKVVTMDGKNIEGLIAVPYIKLRSGDATTPVDQGTNQTINYVLMR